MPTPPDSPYLAPTSPQTGGRPQKSTSPLAPHHYVGRGRTGALPTTSPSNQVAPTNRGDLHPTQRNLITTRTLPFFQLLRDLLTDGDWHHRAQAFTTGRTHHLADRTIANLLPRAAARRWISRSQEHLRLRDQAAFDAALASARDAMEDAR